MHGLAGRLVHRRVAGSDDTAEQARPAEPVDLTAQERAGFVADHTEINPEIGDRAQHRLASRQLRQPVEVDCPEAIEINRARLFPTFAEQLREALSQAEPDPLLGFGQRPFGFFHLAHQKIERVVDRRPAIDDRVVPIEQDRPRPRRSVEQAGLSLLRALRAHAATAAWMRYASRSLRLSGPGLPSATGSPSMHTTGRRSAVVLVRNASRAA